MEEQGPAAQAGEPAAQGAQPGNQDGKEDGKQDGAQDGGGARVEASEASDGSGGSGGDGPGALDFEVSAPSAVAAFPSSPTPVGRAPTAGPEQAGAVPGP